MGRVADAIAPDIRGIDLKHLRVERRLSATTLARAAGWSRQRVTNLEREDRPTAAAVARYLAAMGAS